MCSHLALGLWDSSTYFTCMYRALYSIPRFEQQSHQLLCCRWVFGLYRSCSYHKQRCYERSCVTGCTCKQNLLGHVYFWVMYYIMPNRFPSAYTNVPAHPQQEAIRGLSPLHCPTLRPFTRHLGSEGIPLSTYLVSLIGNLTFSHSHISFL